MKTKLEAQFIPSSYVQDRYARLHSLTQDHMSVEEYTREFQKLLIKCDVQEPKEQTIIRYLGGLKSKYANVVELQQFTTFNEVCVLADKAEQQRIRKLFRQEYPKPSQNEPLQSLPSEQTFNKGSSNKLPPIPPLPPKIQTPQLSPPPELKSYPLGQI